MEKNEAIRRLILAVTEYADGREGDVARGAETPHLAALLVQKYGYALAEAAKIIYGPAAAGAVLSDVDARVARLDPDWDRHARERWSARPADLMTGA